MKKEMHELTTPLEDTFKYQLPATCSNHFGPTYFSAMEKMSEYLWTMLDQTDSLWFSTRQIVTVENLKGTTDL